MSTDPPGSAAAAAAGLDHEVVRFGRVASAEEAAERQGIPLGSLVKTLVVRRAEDDYVFVLIPADRAMDWARLRAVLGERRLSLPDGDEALAATGYRPGTITPLGAARAWPVVADRRVADQGAIALGSGEHGVSIHLDPGVLLDFLEASVAHVTRASA